MLLLEKAIQQKQNSMNREVSLLLVGKKYARYISKMRHGFPSYELVRPRKKNSCVQVSLTETIG